MQSFESYRSLLFSIAYRMTGSVAEAEDLVQETYLRYSRSDPAQINSPKAFLTTIITRLAINVLNSSRVQRESYFGPWLPEPLLTADHRQWVRPGDSDEDFNFQRLFDPARTTDSTGAGGIFVARSL